MSANRLFIVCKYHASLDQALCVAERYEWGQPYEQSRSWTANEWFKRHAACGKGNTCDHFQLAMHRPSEHDAPVTTVDKAVKLSLVKTMIDQEVKAHNDSLESSQEPKTL